MIIRAIKTNQLQFLYCTWAYNKNFESLVDYTGEENESTETEDEDMEKTRKDPTLEEMKAKIQRRKVKYKTYTFDWLIKRVLEYSADDSEVKIRQIAGWKLTGNENFLMSMLLNR